MEPIDITMTATIRPDIIRRTLKSYCKNIFQERDRYRLIINIDPIGEKESPDKIIEICKGFIPNVIYNVPAEPSFPKAVIWTWAQSRTNFVFHLEDDWLLDRYVNINHMIEVLNKYPELACLRFSKYNIPKRERIMLFNAKYEYNPDGFYLTANHNQFGLNPVLIKRDFITEALKIMVTNRNPEKQFRITKKDPKSDMNRLIMKWKFAIYSKPGRPRLAIDNGVNWKFYNKFGKPDGQQFLVWERKHANINVKSKPNT